MFSSSSSWVLELTQIVFTFIMTVPSPPPAHFFLFLPFHPSVHIYSLFSLSLSFSLSLFSLSLSLSLSRLRTVDDRVSLGPFLLSSTLPDGGLSDVQKMFEIALLWTVYIKERNKLKNEIKFCNMFRYKVDEPMFPVMWYRF